MKRFFSALLLFIVFGLSAQNDSVYQWQVRANLQYGIVLPEYGLFKYTTNDYARGFEINFLRKSTGKSYWQQLYRYPGLGMSFYFSTMGNKNYYGNQFTIYPYYNLQLAGNKKFGLSYQMGLGASWATKEYNPETNPYNLVIGSHLNIHYHADLLAEFCLTEKTAIVTGIAFSHISNANLSEPNIGINLAALQLGMRFSQGKKQAVIHSEIPSFTKERRFEIMIAGGMKHTRTFESFSYPALGISADHKWQKRHKFSWGIGIDFFYDSSIEPQMKRLARTFEPIDAFSSGIHLAQEFVYNQISLIVQEGIYIGLKEKLNGYWMYNRAMIRYHFCDHYFVNVSMKSHLYILDFPEIGFGYYW
jgi:hypothetical protein